MRQYLSRFAYANGYKMLQEKTGLYIDQLQAQGRYSFTLEELVKKTGQSLKAIRRALERLQAKTRITRVTRGFYVIIPIEYRQSGMLPAEWFVHDLMNYLGSQYYVGLLSAAALHGAAHQQPQEFQIMVNRQRRAILVKGLRLRFFYKRCLDASSGIVSLKTETGSIDVSGPELTAMDLVRYQKSIGGLSQVASVLAELAEKVKPAALRDVILREKSMAFCQRLGYLLDRLGFAAKAHPLSDWLAAEKPLSVLLDPSRPRGKSPVDRKWRVFENQTIQIDEL